MQTAKTQYLTFQRGKRKTKWQVVDLHSIHQLLSKGFQAQSNVLVVRIRTWWLVNRSSHWRMRFTATTVLLVLYVPDVCAFCSIFFRCLSPNEYRLLLSVKCLRTVDSIDQLPWMKSSLTTWLQRRLVLHLLHYTAVRLFILKFDVRVSC
jgi:hypothetical protein